MKSHARWFWNQNFVYFLVEQFLDDVTVERDLEVLISNFLSFQNIA